jgi:transcriptional regulator with XRE-family HTH domain
MRQLRKCPRSYLAHVCGIDQAALVRLEIGRVPLKYGTAQRIIDQLRVNPLWLATGEGEKEAGFVELPSAKEIGVADMDLFSKVFDDLLRPCFPVNPERRIKPGSSQRLKAYDAILRDTISRSLGERLEEIFYHIPVDDLQKFAVAIIGFAEKFKERYPKEQWDTLLSRKANFAVQTLNRQIFLGQGVDTLSENRKSADVKSELKGLLAKVRTLTKAKGAKTKLAAHIEVPPSRLSEWLAGKYEPSGESTLRLLRWVQEQEH